MSNFSQTSRRICYKIHSECSRQVSIIRSARIKGRCKFKVRCVLQRGFFRESTCCVKIYTTRVFMREYRTISDTGCLVLFFFFFFFLYIYIYILFIFHSPFHDTLFSIENLILGAVDACSETKRILIMTPSHET